jgi:adenylyltransferase/sulfurtransferase
VRVLLIGAGGLGSPVALALTGPGDGARSALTGLTLVDPDVVELSNLHRQILHGDRDLGRRKVDSAADRLAARTPAGFVCERRAVRLDADNAAALFAAHHLVIEGSDDLATKFLVNDTALRLGIPAVIGGVVRFSGQIVTVVPSLSSIPPLGCYRCLFEEPPEPGLAATCQQSGVLGPSCGLVGGLMAAEATRILAGAPPLYAGRVLTVDLLRWRMRRVPLGPRPGCTACAHRRAA